MKEQEIKKRSKYFQSIARHLFKLRGAPFFLSSKELDYVARWEKMGIPLHVVLEGVERSFEIQKGKAGRKAKIQSLAFCDPQVLKAFEQDRERKVGHRKSIVERYEKRDRAKIEVESFLAKLSHQINYLREAYTLAQKVLAQGDLDEEELERLDAEIEELLWENSSDNEKERVKSEVLKDYEFRQKEEFERIFKIKLVKVLRDKYKIPYISLFYY
jgi:hypothetical protein